MLTTRLSHSQAMPSLTLKQFYTLFTTDHHQTLRYRNMNSHPMNSKIHCKFTLQSLPQSPKQFCPFRVPDHNSMLFSFPYTQYVHQYEAPSLHCCFHLILEEQQNLQTVTFQAHRSATKHPSQLSKPPNILPNGHQRFFPPW